MYSRRIKVEEKENKRKAYGFTLLSIAAIAFMFYFGLPILARISNFTYDLRNSSEPVESSDKTPPPPPTVDDLPQFTNKMNIDVSGRTESGVTVVIFVNSKKEEIVTSADGSFNKSVPLNDGENLLRAYSQDTAGNKSQETVEYSVTYDDEEPQLEITSPTDGEEFYGQKQKQMTVNGTSEKDAQIHINDRFVIVNSDGTFTHTIGLNDGENNFIVTATDQAGNKTEKVLSVRFNP